MCTVEIDEQHSSQITKAKQSFAFSLVQAVRLGFSLLPFGLFHIIYFILFFLLCWLCRSPLFALYANIKQTFDLLLLLILKWIVSKHCGQYNHYAIEIYVLLIIAIFFFQFSISIFRMHINTIATCPMPNKKLIKIEFFIFLWKK